MWELPGGKQEPGESLQDCLARELQEELGIRVETGPLVGSQSGRHASGDFTLHCFECRITKGTPHPREHRELAWLTFGQALSYELCPTDRRLLETMARKPKSDEQDPPSG